MKLAWVGTRTDRASETADFFEHVMGLRLISTDNDFWVFQMPDGSKVEVFGPGSPDNQHFTTGPVAGFLVDDFEAAIEELREAGTEIVWGPETASDGNAWVHFRGPDGHLYELTKDPQVSRAI